MKILEVSILNLENSIFILYLGVQRSYPDKIWPAGIEGSKFENAEKLGTDEGTQEVPKMPCSFWHVLLTTKSCLSEAP